MKSDPFVYDCLVIGAGPGGLQAAIHLGRYNRRVLLIDKGAGRTTHAAHIVNYLGLVAVSGRELIATGLEQVKEFGVEVLKDTVTRVEKDDVFTVHTPDRSFQGRYVIASAGAVDNLPRLRNLGRFFGRGFYTCVDCDGYLTTGTKLLVMGNSLNAVRLALGMKQMYTDDLTLLLTDFALPLDYQEAVREDEIAVYSGEPVALFGETGLEGVQLADGRTLPCESIMATFGWRLNDSFLAELPLDRDHERFKILTGSSNESSLPGLYVVGALKPGHSQAIIAAGQGAVAAIDINQKLLEL
ncbi:MAG: NAD(P)/FAD-dependent oxidoreductase [Desulfobulbaceae bacterium]|nr:NAD(P)/FAD-dependent oxidoreductase [Desulfobulbaceae bacterium]